MPRVAGPLQPHAHQLFFIAYSSIMPSPNTPPPSFGLACVTPLRAMIALAESHRARASAMNTVGRQLDTDGCHMSHCSARTGPAAAAAPI